MKFSIFGQYCFPFVLKYLEKDGHTVLFNKFSPDVDVCISESIFTMYEILRNLKTIKRNEIKLINLILDIPPWRLSKDFPLNTSYKYIKQFLFNYTNRNQFLYDWLNYFKPNDNKSKKFNFFTLRVQELFNDRYRNRLFYQKNYRRYLKQADLNLCISKYSQKLVKRFLKLETGVQHICVDSDYLLNLPKTEILYDVINISSIFPHKRQELLVKAAHKLGLKLIILGREPTHNNVQLDCPNFYYPDHNKVMNILNQSNLYVDCSLFEGFGMTTVEAAYLDKISIVSDTFVHREVLGDYPLYFKRDNLDDLVEKMRLVLEGGFKLKNEEIKKLYSIQAFKESLMNHIESLF